MTTNDGIIFEALEGRKFCFNGKMHTPTIMRVWELKELSRGNWEEYLGGIMVEHVDIQTLKDIGAWDKLSPELQHDLETGVVKQVSQKEQMIKERVEKMQAGRRKKYENVPRELECISCHTKVPISPSVLVKKVDKIMADTKSPYTIADYVKSFKCKECSPVKRGKKSNPEFNGLPREMTCKCGKKAVVNATYLKAKAEKTGTTIQELIKNFRCQICVPTKGRAKKVNT